MNLKKNAFSYVLWLCYVLLTGVFALGLTVNVATANGYPAETGLAVCVGAFVIAGLLVLGLHKLFSYIQDKRTYGGTEIPILLLQSFLVVVLLAVGIYLRIEGLANAGQEAAYFETAMVAQGQEIPQVVHGAVYIYLQILHLAFLLFGNKMLVGVWVQIILQLGAGLFFYYGVRKLAGSVAAIVMFAFLMLSPGMVAEAVLLSPRMFFLFASGLVFLILSCMASAEKDSALVYVIAGLLISLVIYLDILGGLLLIPGCIMAFTYKKQNSFGQALLKVLVCILCTILGMALILGIDAVASSGSITGVFDAWTKLYQPEAFQLPFTVTAQSSYIGFYIEIAILVFCLALGIFSFWCRRKIEVSGMWIIAVLALIGLQCFQMIPAEMNPSGYLFLLLTVLGGIGVGEIFQKDFKPVLEVPDTPKQAPRKKLEILDMETLTELPETKQIHFIENPLPLPKKHEKRVMDYRQKTEEKDMDFDFDVPDDDDFDV